MSQVEGERIVSAQNVAGPLVGDRSQFGTPSLGELNTRTFGTPSLGELNIRKFVIPCFSEQAACMSRHYVLETVERWR